MCIDCMHTTRGPKNLLWPQKGTDAPETTRRGRGRKKGRKLCESMRRGATSDQKSKWQGDVKEFPMWFDHRRINIGPQRKLGLAQKLKSFWERFESVQDHHCLGSALCHSEVLSLDPWFPPSTDASPCPLLGKVGQKHGMDLIKPQRGKAGIFFAWFQLPSGSP